MTSRATVGGGRAGGRAGGPPSSRPAAFPSAAPPVEDIERGNGKTEVIVDEGITTASYDD